MSLASTFSAFNDEKKRHDRTAKRVTECDAMAMMESPSHFMMPGIHQVQNATPQPRLHHAN